MLNAEIPLPGIGILDQRVHVPLHLLERRGGWQSCAAQKWIFRGDNRILLVQVVGQKLPSAGPCAFIVLRHLVHRRPVVEEPTERTAEDVAAAQAISKTKSRLNVIKC